MQVLAFLEVDLVEMVLMDVLSPVGIEFSHQLLSVVDIQ